MKDDQRLYLRLGIIGFILGALVEFLIVAMINIGNGGFSLIAGNLSERYGNAVALILQIMLPGLMGGINFAATFVYNSDRFNIVTATITHATIVLITILSVGSFMEWFELTFASVAIFLALMTAIYIMIWFLMYSKSKAEIERINEALEKRRSEEK